MVEPTDALVRPFVASRCDGDVLPIHRPVSRAMQAGLRLGLIDPVVASIVGPMPFQGPFGIGHECIAQVTAVGDSVSDLAVGDVVVVPWAVSCGTCPECRQGLTAKCSTMRATSPGGTLAAFGFGPSSGPWGGMTADSLRIPFADHMLVKVPAGVDPLRVAAASDNLADAWRAVVPPPARATGRIRPRHRRGRRASFLPVPASVVRRSAERRPGEGFGVQPHVLVGAASELPLSIDPREAVEVHRQVVVEGLARSLRDLANGPPRFRMVSVDRDDTGGDELGEEDRWAGARSP